MTRYAEALDARERCLRWWAKEMRRRAEEVHPPTVVRITAALAGAETYYWGSDICTTISYAAGSMPPSWTLTPEMLPSRNGFFHFTESLGWSIEGYVTVGILALLWTSYVSDDGEPAVLFGAFSESDLRSGTTFMSMTIRHHQTFKEASEVVAPRIQGRDDAIALAGMSLAIPASLSFLRQRIFVAPRAPIDRASRRRLTRNGRPAEDVRVVQLRKRVPSAPTHTDATPVEWSHRWVVSGHWREQWYPRLQRNQPIWVLPYVKGPENKPLKVKPERIFAVVR